MTMMNGLDVCDVDSLDEEFFGPPPRFLRERTPIEENGEGELYERAGQVSTLGKIRAFLTGEWRRRPADA